MFPAMKKKFKALRKSWYCDRGIFSLFFEGFIQGIHFLLHGYILTYCYMESDEYLLVYKTKDFVSIWFKIFYFFLITFFVCNLFFCNIEQFDIFGTILYYSSSGSVKYCYTNFLFLIICLFFGKPSTVA